MNFKHYTAIIIMDNFNINFMSNTISTIIVEHFNLNMKYIFVFATLIATSFSYLTSVEFNYTLLFSYGTYLAIFIGLLFFIYKNYGKNEYNYIKTYDITDKHLIEWFYTNHPEIFTKKSNMLKSSPYDSTNSDFVVPDINEKMFFNDTIHEVKGYITTKVDEVFKKQGESSWYTCVIIYVHKNSKYNACQYIEQLYKYRKEHISKSTDIVLWVVKPLCSVGNGDDSRTEFYEAPFFKGKKTELATNYEKYIKSYFSSSRQELWEYIYNIHHHPEKFSRFGQEARCNLLLYGPPGSGKSTFAYRLAMALGRHIFSLDISLFCDDRAFIYNTINQAMIDGMENKPEEYIILLEEFDVAINYLIEQKKPKILIDEEKSVTFKKEENAKTNRTFQIEDLLELLQGSVPLKGSIIIATTNKYQEIKELCPSLFRPGRLSPVEFGYMDWKSLQELSLYYFKQELSLPEVHIKIPTSEIIEVALKASLKDSFEFFENNLKEKLK